MAALLATTERIVRVISRGQVYESVYLKNSPAAPTDNLSKNLQSALTTIYTTSLELLADSGSLFSKNTAMRTLQALINPGKVSGGISSISEQEDDLLRDVSACEVRRSANADESMIGMLNALNAPMKRMDEGIQHLLQTVNEEERIKMLEWISPIPFGKNHNNVREKRTAGTGGWLLQHEGFNQWEHNRSSIFWLQGSPGTGKTFLTSAVVDRIQDKINENPKDEGFAFFYCDKNETRRSQPLSILQSIVRQLSTTAKSPEATQTKLHELYTKCRQEGTTFGLETCKEQIRTSLDIYEQTIIVIDAMDECDPDSRDELIDALKSFVSESNNRPVKIFISSRPDPDIGNLLENSPNIGINANDNKGDIQKYLSAEMDKVAKKAPFFGRLKSKIIDALLERCQGMFQWAALQTHQIQKCKTESSVWKRLESLPDGLQKAYDEAWSQVEELEEPDRMLTERAMLWVMAAELPLSTSQLICAVRVNTNGEEPALADEIDESGLLSLCNNLLTIDSELKVWRFSHLSVREYLESRMQWTLPLANFHAASACLTWLITMYDKEDITLIDLSDYDGKPEPADIFHLMHPFHVYIRHHWAKHIQGAQDDEDGNLSSLLKTFLGSPEDSSKQYQRWFETIREELVRIIMITEGEEDYDLYLGAGGFDEEGQDTYDFNQAAHPEYSEFESELGPADKAIFAMCHLSFNTILSDWWQNKEFEVSHVNERGHNLLTLAARAGCTPICQRLIAKGAEVNLQVHGETYGSALVAAAHRGHTETVKCLVEAGADVNMLMEHGTCQTALTAALRSGNTEIARYLVQEAKADVNQSFAPKDEEEDEDFEPIALFTPVALAAKIGNLELLQLLVDAGANVNVPEQSGNPLAVAIRFSNRKCATYLIQQANADVRLPMIEASFVTILERAASDDKNLEVVKLLVEAGAEVNPAECGDYTPLGAAVRGFNRTRGGSTIGIVKYLVEAGANIHRSGAEASVTLLAVFGEDVKVLRYLVESGAELDVPKEFTKATELRYVDVIKYLIQQGADVNARLSGEYGSVLERAGAEDVTLRVTKALVEAGANVNLLSKDGEYGSPLAATAASYLGGMERVRYLLQKGADVNLSLPQGKYGNALNAAATNRYEVDTVKHLIGAGADVNASAQHGEYGSALVAAALLSDNELIVKALIEAGANVNQQVSRGEYGSALAAAASQGNLKIAELLLESGADVNMHLESGNYRTALEAAEAKEEEESADLLRNHGATA
jgi:ankyrin repeat protein